MTHTYDLNLVDSLLAARASVKPRAPHGGFLDTTPVRIPKGSKPQARRIISNINSRAALDVDRQARQEFRFDAITLELVKRGAL